MKIKLILFALLFLAIGAFVDAYKLQSPDTKASVTIEGNGSSSTSETIVSHNPPINSGGTTITNNNLPTLQPTPQPVASPNVNPESGNSATPQPKLKDC